MLERPRRDNIDTAYWASSLKTDANGNARVSFTMPDALTRWRITGRAMDEQGRVGQRTAYLRSDKNFYAKWTAPDWMRAGDAPRASVAVFNQTGKEQALDVVLSGGAQPKTEKLSAKPGVNYVEFPLAAGATGPLRLELKQNGKLVDALDTAMQTLPAAWSSPRTLVLPLDGATSDIPLKLPADARNIRVSFAQGAASQFARIADDLIDYPYGCVEQTASRLIPLALATQSLGPDAGAAGERLQTLLDGAAPAIGVDGRPQRRLRLVGQCHGRQCLDDGLRLLRGLVRGARAAHRAAARALEQAAGRLQRTWLEGCDGRPRAGAVDGARNGLAHAGHWQPAWWTTAPSPSWAASRARRADSSSLLLGGALDREAQAMSLGLVALVAGQNGIALPHGLQLQVASAWQVLRESKAPVAQALLMLAGEVPPSQADAVLAGVRAEMPTLDRAMTLMWVQKKLGGASFGKGPAVTLDGAWQKRDSRSGQPVWRWNDAKGQPDKLRLAAPAPAGTVAVLQYDSHAVEVQTLPVAVERRILRMKAGKGGYTTELVKPGEVLSTDALYLDEITLKAAPGAKHRFGLLEVALPPGAMVESTTWGMVMAGDKPAALETRAPHRTPRRLCRADRAFGRRRDGAPFAALCAEGQLCAAACALLPHVSAGAESL